MNRLVAAEVSDGQDKAWIVRQRFETNPRTGITSPRVIDCRAGTGLCPPGKVLNAVITGGILTTFLGDSRIPELSFGS